MHTQPQVHALTLTLALFEACGQKRRDRKILRQKNGAALTENYSSAPNFSVYRRVTRAPGTAAMLIRGEFRGAALHVLQKPEPKTAKWHDAPAIEGQPADTMGRSDLHGGLGLRNGQRRPGLGSGALYPVTWKRVHEAATRAVLDPVTWLPAAGAAVFAIDDWDAKTSSWAAEHTPIFGSQESAENASGDLLNVLYGGRDSFQRTGIGDSRGIDRDWVRQGPRVNTGIIVDDGLGDPEIQHPIIVRCVHFIDDSLGQ